jgi:transcriptional regulator of arginine metabolism
MSKLIRHKRILELVSETPIGNQEELKRRLLKSGIEVTQATLSRDIKELGLVKGATGYAVPGADLVPEEPGPSLERLAREFVTEVREAQNLLVLKTSPGSAQPVAVSLDAQEWPEIVGTVAGDDTVLIVAPDVRACVRLADRINQMLQA